MEHLAAIMFKSSRRSFYLSNADKMEFVPDKTKALKFNDQGFALECMTAAMKAHKFKADAVAYIGISTISKGSGFHETAYNPKEVLVDNEE